MTQSKKKFRNTMLGVLGAFTLIATPVLAVSCSSGDSTLTSYTEANDKKVKTLVDNYRDAFSEKAGVLYTNAQLGDLKALVNDYLDQASIFSYSELSVDGRIWLNSFIDELETQQVLLDSNIHYLILDGNRLGFTHYNNDVAGTIDFYISQLQSGLKKSIDKGKLTEEEAKANAEIYKKNLPEYLKACETNLRDGMANNITLSYVMFKHVMGNLLQYDFMTQTMDEYAATGTAPTRDKIKNMITVHDYVTEDEAKTITDQVLHFVNFLVTEYYPAINYGKTTGAPSTYTLKVVNDAPDEEDNGFVYTPPKAESEAAAQPSKYIEGLGLTKDDLATKDVGVGFTPNADGYGAKIYNALLKVNSNTDKTANQIFTLGNDGVAAIKANMTEVAKVVGAIYAGDKKAWSPKVWYDADSSGNAEQSQELTLNVIRDGGEVNLPDFFKWLNSDQWFNGRDMEKKQYPTWNGNMDGKILSKYTAAGEGAKNPENWDGRTEPYTYAEKFTPKNKGITPVKISDVIGAKGDTKNETVVKGDAGNLAWKYLDLGLSPATIQQPNSKKTNLTETNSISPEAAFVGTSHSIQQYLQYKDVSVYHFNGMFKNTSVDWTLRTGTGGAAYASSGKGSWDYVPDGTGGFYLDSNPYSGLQKWSMTTLATHESVSGHVYQFNYAHDHPAKSYAPKFRSTAYAEGWGLFSEWLAVQIGMYGKPENPTEKNHRLPLPNFGVESKNINVSQFTNKYDYANGVYWIEDDKSTPDVTEDAGNSQKLYDAVQYFGFLNERQLRAMRCAVDVGLHAGGATINEQGEITGNVSEAGKFAKNTGWSLKDARAYLTNNSGLGIDDIKRETKRYLGYTGQAVSYYNGLNVIEGLYMQAKNTYETNNEGKDFLNWSLTSATNANTAPLFDIILRNGNVPIQVLNQAVTNFIRTTY